MKGRYFTRAAALIMSVLVAFGMPAAVLAEGAPAAEQLKAYVQQDGSVSVKGLSSDDLLMQYIDQKVAEETRSDNKRGAVHSRKDKLDAVAWNMYDAMAPMIREVADGNRSDTNFVVPVSAIFESASFGAEDLGVDSLFEEGPDLVITREAFNAFMGKLTDVLNAQLSDMLSAMISDMPYELYWFDNVNGISFELDADWFVNNMNIYTDGTIGVEPDDTPTITFSWYVSQDYSEGGTAESYGPERTTKVDTDFTKAAANTAKNISGIIEKAKGEPDVHKLVLYKNEICRLTSYHQTAMEDPDFPYGDPWQLIYVFDGDENTNVVCEGYSKAFQYLCDNTTFADKNVESRLVSGLMTHITTKGTTSGKHMWNIVHMDDGYNYIADITNTDDDDDPSAASGTVGDVFLSGAINGTATAGYVYQFGDGTLKFEYDAEMFNIFDKSELTLSVNTYPAQKGNAEKLNNTLKASGKTVSLKLKDLKKKSQTIKASKAYSVSKAKGSVSYKLVKVNKSSAKKKFSVAKNGKITVKKGLKKGTYKLTVSVTAAGTSKYKKLTKKVTVTVKVK